MRQSHVTIWIAAAALAAACGPASTAGFWQCENKVWVAVSNPTHSMPSKPCDWTPPHPQSESVCMALGGIWAPVGIFPRPVCRRPTSDAGNVCGDDGECESACIAELNDAQKGLVKSHRPVLTLGQCASTSLVVGCQAIVVEGKVNGITCYD